MNSMNGFQKTSKVPLRKDQPWTKVGANLSFTRGARFSCTRKKYLWQVVCLVLYFLYIIFLPDQLSRLHMILKPFMLRRIKRDVENELSEKVQTLRVSFVKLPSRFKCYKIQIYWWVKKLLISKFWCVIYLIIFGNLGCVAVIKYTRKQ